jgi:hypothetical protein
MLMSGTFLGAKVPCNTEYPRLAASLPNAVRVIERLLSTIVLAISAASFVMNVRYEAPPTATMPPLTIGVPSCATTGRSGVPAKPVVAPKFARSTESVTSAPPSAANVSKCVNRSAPPVGVGVGAGA